MKKHSSHQQIHKELPEAFSPGPDLCEWAMEMWKGMKGAETAPPLRLPLRASQFPAPNFAAFTLIELLVSSAILALMLVVFLSISNYASQAWKGSQEKMEEFSTARIAMNRIRADLETAVIRPDLPLFPANAMGFMTMKRGMIDDPRLLCYVEYVTNASNQLIQKSQAYTLDNAPPFSTNSSIDAPTTAIVNNLADGVVGFQVAYLNRDKTSGALTWTNKFASKFETNSVATVAVRVSLAIVSSQGLKYLQDTGKLAGVTQAMAGALTDPANSAEVQWNSKINAGDAAIDHKTAGSLRTFERVISLPDSN